MPLTRPQNHVTRAQLEAIGRSREAGWPYIPAEIVDKLEEANPVTDLIDMAPGADRERLTGKLQLIRQLRAIVDSYADFSAQDVTDEAEVLHALIEKDE